VVGVRGPPPPLMVGVVDVDDPGDLDDEVVVDEVRVEEVGVEAVRVEEVVVEEVVVEEVDVEAVGVAGGGLCSGGAGLFWILACLAASMSSFALE
jgi:hypothetical protein